MSRQTYSAAPVGSKRRGAGMAATAKECTKCKVTKPAEAFHRDKSKKYGLETKCKACRKAYYEANKKKISAQQKAFREANKEKMKARGKAWREANREKVRAGQKAYYEANKEKIKAYYEANKEKKKASDKAYREANKEKIKASRKAYREANKEKIKARMKAYYEANKEKRKAYREANKEKIKEKYKVYYEANKDKRNAYCRAWHEANKKKVKGRKKAYNEANKEKRKAYLEANKERTRAYERAKKKANPSYKFLCNYRARLNQFFSGKKKTAPTVIALGCSAKHACDHLESQFADGMTWDNYGTAWVVDHIFPLAKADLHDSVEFLAVCNWRNLQPLTPEENREKSDKVTPEARRLFEELCKQFASKGDEGVLRRREAPVSKKSKKAALTTNLAAH